MKADDIDHLERDLSTAVEDNHVIVEDHHGRRFTITRTRVVGAATDDPGLVIRIVEEGTEALF